MGITIGKIPLGRISIGSISIGRLGKKSAGSSAPRDLYKRILNSMPSALRESLVAWYSPNLQGLTNAELADSLNEYVDGLKDLSGNGNHMTLYNFSGVGPESDENGNGGGYVNADGNLGFDGVDDEAVGTIPDVAVVVTADGQTAVDSEDITLGVNGSGSHIVMTLVERIYFDRELNSEELTWVLENMTGENAHVETKYNQVTLYCGDFDEDGTLIDDSYDVFTFSVQHGNSLNDADGNLLSKYHKDIDATHCTSDTWYDTDGLEYAGEAITEDCTFYCERQKISDYMLEQLDALTLSDGSTAKEHLVCWYQPKLQGLTKESVLADKVLADLSGNGYDMTLYGFTEDEECIASDGALCFDGNGEHGKAQIAPIKSSSYATILVLRTLSTNTCWIVDYRKTVRSEAMQLVSGYNGGYCENRTAWNRVVNQTTDVVTIISNYERCNDIQIAWSNTSYDNEYLTLGKHFNNTNNNWKGELYLMITFNNNLTESIINSVKNILKLS